MHWTEPATADDSHAAPEKNGAERHRLPARAARRVRAAARSNDRKTPTSDISVHGQERVTDTSRLARLNLAVLGLSEDIKQWNTYYEDLPDSVGRFDFVLANPPFNVRKIDKERLSGECYRANFNPLSAQSKFQRSDELYGYHRINDNFG